MIYIVAFFCLVFLLSSIAVLAGLKTLSKLKVTILYVTMFLIICYPAVNAC